MQLIAQCDESVGACAHTVRAGGGGGGVAASGGRRQVRSIDEAWCQAVCRSAQPVAYIHGAAVRPNKELGGMPHVKGNKFKPAPPPKAPAQPPAEPAMEAAPDGPRPSKILKRQQPESNNGRQQQQQQHEQEKQQPRRASLPKQQPVISGARPQGQQGDGQHPNSSQQRPETKRKLQHQRAAPLAAPAIPTVVAPPPKAGKPSVDAATSNWAVLQATLAAGKTQSKPRHKRRREERAVEAAVPGKRPQGIGSDLGPTKASRWGVGCFTVWWPLRALWIPGSPSGWGSGSVAETAELPVTRTLPCWVAPGLQVIALDCEMVGVGPYGQQSVLAR